MIELNQKISSLRQEIEGWIKLQKEFDDLKELSHDPIFEKEIERLKLELWRELEEREIEIFLSGVYEKIMLF